MRFDSDEEQELIRGINSLRNKYSVMATAVGRPVEVHAYADRITHHCEIVETGNESWRFKNRA